MLLPGPAQKVIVHLNEDTGAARDFLYAEIFRFLYDHGVAGATMLRPHAGFGTHHMLHTAGAGSVEGEHLPVRIEFLESASVVESILPALCELVTDGLVEVQDTTVVKAAQQVKPL